MFALTITAQGVNLLGVEGAHILAGVLDRMTSIYLLDLVSDGETSLESVMHDGLLKVCTLQLDRSYHSLSFKLFSRWDIIRFLIL
jgi:hypothetical protein